MRAWGLVVVGLVGAVAGGAPPAVAQDGGLAVVSSRGIPQTLQRERPRRGWFGRNRDAQAYRGGVVGLLEAQPPKGFERTRVAFASREAAGTIIIDSQDKYLYRVERGGTATRYGIGVGREGFVWAGRERVSRKAKWPSWRPPAEMLRRDPTLPTFMDGGVRNPLGARALYLGSTLYRIHGTNEPWTIGTAQSSGCIRMTNRDVMDLFDRTRVGASVIVLGPNSDRSMLTAALGGGAGARQVAAAPRGAATAVKQAPTAAMPSVRPHRRRAIRLSELPPVDRGPAFTPTNRGTPNPASAAPNTNAPAQAATAPAVPATPRTVPAQVATAPAEHAGSLADRFGAVPWWKRVTYKDLGTKSAPQDPTPAATHTDTELAPGTDVADQPTEAAQRRLPAIY